MSNGSVGLAFQGGCFLAGAIATGVVHALVDRKAFDEYDINAFSGTSAGALVAAMCWGHKLRGTVPSLPADLRRQWLHNANGLIPTEEWGVFWKLFDRWMSLSPIYFAWKNSYLVPIRHEQFKEWLTKYVEPEECMKAMFDKYVGPNVKSAGAGWLQAARMDYYEADSRPRLVVGTAEIHGGDVVTIDDEDLFEALLDAFDTALGKGNVIGDSEAVERARGRAIEVAGEYMTRALMTSGSLDTINGMTQIDDIDGLSNEALLHKGHYLDGAWATDPPIADLTNCDVGEIWAVEIFPKLCPSELDTNEKREDRREELSQTALVEHELQSINRMNMWVASGRLMTAAEFEPQLDAKWADAEKRAEIIGAFKKTVPHADRYSENEIKARLLKEYRKIRTLTISLPADLQPLTDGARIVNSPAFLTDKMNRGYQNALDFLDRLH